MFAQRCFDNHGASLTCNLESLNGFLDLHVTANLSLLSFHSEKRINNYIVQVLVLSAVNNQVSNALMDTYFKCMCIFKLSSLPLYICGRDMVIIALLCACVCFE